MSTSPSVFPFAHIALTAAITAGVAFLLLVALRARFKVLVGFYATFRRPTDAVRFAQARVLLTLVSFVINVVTI